MPLRLYRAPHCSFLYAQSFLIGLAYYGNFFYLPIYFQSVLTYSPPVSGALILPIVITTSFGSILSGQLMGRWGRYMPCILAGFILWTLGAGLKLMFKRSTGLGALIPILVVEGAGIGLTLQPTLVGMYANSRSEDRAVTTGLRNFIRTIGGAFGLVVSGAILSNTLSRDLTQGGYMDGKEVASLTSSMNALGAMGLEDEKMERILAVYMKGLHYIFILYAVCAALALALTAGVGNTDLKAKAPPAEQPKAPEASGDDEAGRMNRAERGEAET
ncbi:MFS transporter M2 like protein [Verticillium longisporum]|uniref:MFS transporter M2 like protein n=1 Tax=Verticillium longisporum TaxID=100787 RepID=A0A8I2ZRQ0_VERLO|nr:MFS transporter M2 like protein [Verticillium longisporum]KAG7136351.1 MFS transporter M2 like protein [Verticillium longisporum]